jgi:hypothetical protein
MTIRVRYTPVENNPASKMPRLALTLRNKGRAVEVIGLVDTGSAVNGFWAK